MKSIRHTITRACLGAVLSLSMVTVPVYSSIGNVYAQGNNGQTVTTENDSAKNYSNYDKNSGTKNNDNSNSKPSQPKPDPGKKNNNNNNKKPSGGSKNNGGGKKNGGGNKGGNGGGGGGSFNTSMMNGGGLPSASRLSAKDRQIAENLLGQKIPGDSSNASGKITINGGTAITTETKSYAQVSTVTVPEHHAFGPSLYHWYTWTKDKSMAGMSGGYNAAVAGTYSPANSGTTEKRTRQYTSDRAVWMAVLGDPMYNNTITMTATQSAKMVTTTKTTRIDQVVKTVNNDNLKAVYGRGVTYNIKTTLSGKDKTDNQKAKQKRTSYVASGNDTFSRAKG